MDLVKKFLNAEFIRFLLTGVLNTAFGYGLYALSYYITGHEGVALAIDYVIGAFFNYKSYSLLVFSQYNKKRFIMFCLVYVFTYLLNYLIVFLLMNKLTLNAYVSQLVALTICPLVLFVLLKKYVFLHEETDKELQDTL